MTTKNVAKSTIVPIKENLFITPITSPEEAKLAGSRCRSCGEVSFGKRATCPNCTDDNIEVVPLSRRGKLWTYTVIRNRPPGDYKIPDPFVPFGLGLVELPDGVRVLAPIDHNIKQLKIGMDLELVVYKLYRNEEGKDVMAFKFRAV